MNYFKLISIVVLFISTFNCKGQQFQKIYTMSGSSINGNSICYVNDYRYGICGKQSPSMHILFCNEEGGILWQKILSDTLSVIGTDIAYKNNHIYLVGQTTNKDYLLITTFDT
jgi:hypothetical protein